MRPRPHGAYAFRVRVPLTLREKFGKPFITEGLGTGDPRKAEHLAAQRAVYWRNVFERARHDTPLTLGEVQDEAAETYKSTLATLEAHAPIMSELAGTEKAWLESLLRVHADIASVAPEVAKIERKLGVTLEAGSETHTILSRALLRATQAAITGRMKILESEPFQPPANFLGPEGFDRLTLKPITLTRRSMKGATKGPWPLFELWIATVKPAVSTVNRWRAVFQALQSKFGTEEISEDMARAWARSLITEDRTPITVRDIWLSAAKTVYAWAVSEKHIDSNPFAQVKVTVPDKIETRESKAFTAAEIRTILDASSAVTVGGAFDAAKRWCPWLAAYSGARMGELTQLRAEDVQEVDGVWSMRLTPEAGTVKTKRPRTVPLHEDLIAMGFLEFVQQHCPGPLFYNQRNGHDARSDATAPRRPRAVKTRERLAGWIRSLGVTDRELSPTHGFRHSFKAIADRAGILEKYSDAITGHAHAKVARRYGAPTVSDLAAALKLFPRY